MDPFQRQKAYFYHEGLSTVELGGTIDYQLDHRKFYQSKRLPPTLPFLLLLATVGSLTFIEYQERLEQAKLTKPQIPPSRQGRRKKRSRAPNPNFGTRIAQQVDAAVGKMNTEPTPSAGIGTEKNENFVEPDDTDSSDDDANEEETTSTRSRGGYRGTAAAALWNKGRTQKIYDKDVLDKLNKDDTWENDPAFYHNTLSAEGECDNERGCPCFTDARGVVECQTCNCIFHLGRCSRTREDAQRVTGRWYCDQCIVAAGGNVNKCLGLSEADEAEENAGSSSSSSSRLSSKLLRRPTDHYNTCRHPGCRNTEAAPYVCVCCPRSCCKDHILTDGVEDVIILKNKSDVTKMELPEDLEKGMRVFYERNDERYETEILAVHYSMLDDEGRPYVQIRMPESYERPDGKQTSQEYLTLLCDSNIGFLGSEDDENRERRGGTYLCQECSSTLNEERVLNMDVINARPKSKSVANKDFLTTPQSKLVNNSNFVGSGRTILSGEEMTPQYHANDRPLYVRPVQTLTVNEIPPKKKQARGLATLKERMTQATGSMVCPGCGSSECDFDGSNACNEQYPYGMNADEYDGEGDDVRPKVLMKLRAHVTELLSLRNVDHAYDFIMQFVTFEEKVVKKDGKKNGNEKRIFAHMGDVVQSRVDAGVKCNFCKRVTEQILKRPVPVIKGHGRRSKNGCKGLYEDGTNYVLMHSARTRATYTIPGPPGGKPIPVSEEFFCRLFNLSTTTLGRKVKEKRNNCTAHSRIQKRHAGHGQNAITPLQMSNLEAILEDPAFPQSQSHYSPASRSKPYRYQSGTTKASFWYKYCEIHDDDFFSQCERLKHRHGLDETSTRPADEIYLADARKHLGMHNQMEAIESAFERRKALRVEIAKINRSVCTAEEEEKLEDLEKKLKQGRGVSLLPNVSYTTAWRFYSRYNIKIDNLQCDTCTYCASMLLKINRASGTTKERLREELHAHQKMAKEGYDWRQEDREAAQAEGSTTYVAVIDFGQKLRTPTLSSGASWYRMVLGVFPYIICTYGRVPVVVEGGDGGGVAATCASAETHYYMWTETDGQKGANEVISCVHRTLLEEMPDTAEHLIFHFDGCYGQVRKYFFFC